MPPLTGSCRTWKAKWWTPAYLDVLGLRHGRANALALFISSGAPTRADIERSALTAAARRLR